MTRCRLPHVLAFAAKTKTRHTNLSFLFPQDYGTIQLLAPYLTYEREDATIDFYASIRKPYTVPSFAQNLSVRGIRGVLWNFETLSQQVCRPAQCDHILVHPKGSISMAHFKEAIVIVHGAQIIDERLLQYGELADGGVKASERLPLRSSIFGELSENITGRLWRYTECQERLKRSLFLSGSLVTRISNINQETRRRKRKVEDT